MNDSSKHKFHSAGDFLESVKKGPALPAILAPDRKTLSYGQMYQHVDHVICLLNDYGLGRNDRIAVVLPNGPEMAVAFLSVIAGAIIAPLNPAYKEKEFDFYLSDINARAVIVQAEMDSPVRSVARSCNIPIIELIPLKEAEAGLFNLEFNGGISASANKGFSGPDDTALILHTSGTTSRPKIVPLAQRNIFASAFNVSTSLQLNASDRCLNVMPLFHIHGLIAALLSSLSVKGSVICTSGFSDKSFFDWIERFHPTWYTSVPTIHQLVLELAEKHTSRANKAAFRFIRSSSSSLPPIIMKKLEATFNVPVIEAYGMTEAAHQMATNPMPPLVRKPGSVGLPAGPDVAIMDDKDYILPNGDTGEIVIRGENVMKGYENNPDANDKAFSRGWFRTGDLGYLDEEGYLYISGRLKEIINRGGQKISPREIDDVLLEHPSVLQAVAFSVPHNRLGETVAVVTVIDKEKAVTERELRQYVADRLAPYKVPQQVLFVDSIPKGPTGKVQRIGLAEKLSDLLHPKFASPETETEHVIAKIWRKLLGLEKIGKHDNFFILGGDSLLAMQVITLLTDEFGFETPVLTIFQYPVLTELAEEIDHRQSSAAEKTSSPDFYTLFPIQTRGTKHPLFWLQSVQLSSLLPGYLGKDQPLYALTMQGIDGMRARFKTTKEITSHYVQEILTIQPSGPYFLGGYCWGARYAFEIAHQLLEQGEDVALLFLIEPLLSSARANSGRRVFTTQKHWIRRHLKNLAKLPFSKKVSYISERGGIRPLVKSVFSPLLYEAYFLLSSRPLPPSLRSGYMGSVYRRASRDFIQKKYPKEIIIVQAEIGNHAADADWSNLAAGGVIKHVIQGAYHSDLDREYYLDIWSQLLNTYLANIHNKLEQKNNPEKSLNKEV
ncbi:MAG: acyl-CoA synthetase [Nitrospiraceae bacterium]|nr:MAG: acyl-CoA synthetase [Nitrospiraceae bacterium]